jgi:hypothetical protein
MHENAENWPELPLKAWEDTYRTLHMWTQIAGKIRLTLSPRQNHWWNVALYVTARGLTTSPIPCNGRSFEIEFDFVDHRLELRSSSGETRALALAAQSVAAFYRELMSELRRMGFDVRINIKPQEVADPVLFDRDEKHSSYDPEYANRLWRILLSTHEVFQEFRAQFIGKCSPVHFFWGSFDLCCTRFSGRPAPPRKGIITSEAYSHECCSLGWWPGGGAMQSPAFYAYMAPEPPGYGSKPLPSRGYYSDGMHEFFLMYEDIRAAKSPRAEILNFAQSTYAAGADLAGWDRAALERKEKWLKTVRI